MIRSIRLLGAAFGGIVGLALDSIGAGLFLRTPFGGPILVVWVALWMVVGFAILPYLTVVPAGWLIRAVQTLSTAEFVTAVAGLLLGLLMGLLLGLPLSALPAPAGTWLPLEVSIFLGLGMMGVTVAKRHDLSLAVEAMGLFKRGERAAEVDAQYPLPHIVVDTSVLIDGRVGEIVDSGFLYGTLVVPRFVLEELQQIADSSDTLRRNRGRRGLEILSRLQKDSPTPVLVVDDEAPDVKEVDAKLVATARARSRTILTNDFNLNKVAELQGIRVLNINSLANAIKPAVLPGEQLHVRIIQEGKEAGQGVGFLDDGTMIVVEGGSRYIDRDSTSWSRASCRRWRDG